MRRSLVLYVVFLAVFGAAIVVSLRYGKRLEAGRNGPSGAASAPAAAPSAGPASPLDAGPFAALRQPLAHLVLQLLVVVALARLLGAAFTRFGQPAVIGEVVAGIVLGPSVLGGLSPGAFGFLFPAASMGTLKLLAELGVLLFMFAVGLELDGSQLRGKAHSAVVVSHASILVPYLLGVLLALLLYRSLAPPGVPFVSFALFIGIAMSITAFPVLARILDERGISRTALGSTAITCAAVDDVTAWSILALVVAIVRSRGIGASALTIVLVIAFALAMLRLVGPGVRRLVGERVFSPRPGKTVIAGVLTLVLASALTTELIGVHALFGAFLAGVVMPREERFRTALVERTEELASVLLLPLFFAFTGLRTQIGLLADARAWLVCGLVIVVATAGKLGGTWLAARLSGMETWDAFALGALMNTRGLMELIALNVGYELGILSPRIFAMMVLMALVTTFATGPLLALGERLRRRSSWGPHGAGSLRPVRVPAAHRPGSSSGDEARRSS